MYNNDSIIAKLKELKVKSGLTNAQIAKNSNGELPESTINRIFMGKTKNPTIATIIILARAMGFKATDVFDETFKVDVETDAPQVVVPTIDANVYNEMIKMYKDIIATNEEVEKKKDNAIKWLFVSLIIAVLVAAIFIGIDLASGEFGLFRY